MLRTGKVAKYLGISCRTASKLIDEGYIKGYKINKERRVTYGDFITFCTKNDIPIPDDLLKKYDFDEYSLREDIIRVWGPHGCHIEIYDHLLKKANLEIPKTNRT